MSQNYNRFPKGGYGIVQRTVMQDPTITMQAKTLYGLLASMTGDKEHCWPSVERMAEYMGTSRKTIIRYLQELEQKNIIIKSKLYPGTMTRHNKYTVLLVEPKPETEEEKKVNDPGEVSISNPEVIYRNDPEVTSNNNILNNNKVNTKNSLFPFKEKEIKQEKEIVPFETKDQRLFKLKIQIDRNLKTANLHRPNFTKLQKDTFEYLYIMNTGKARMAWPASKAGRWSKSLKEMQESCFLEAPGDPAKAWTQSLRGFAIKFTTDSFLQKRGFTPNIMAENWETLLSVPSTSQSKNAEVDMEINNLINSFNMGSETV